MPVERKRLTAPRREGVINRGKSTQRQDVMDVSLAMKFLVRSSICSDGKFD